MSLPINETSTPAFNFGYDPTRWGLRTLSTFVQACGTRKATHNLLRLDLFLKLSQEGCDRTFRKPKQAISKDTSWY